MVAAQLFDKGRSEAGVGFEFGELLGVVEEGDDALKVTVSEGSWGRCFGGSVPGQSC